VSERRLLVTGVVGTLVAVLCCATPWLALALAGIGLGAVVGYLDAALIPALIVFIGIAVYGLLKRGRPAA
jgi:mercuric ion transport protein